MVVDLPALEPDVAAEDDPWVTSVFGSVDPVLNAGEPSFWAGTERLSRLPPSSVL